MTTMRKITFEVPEELAVRIDEQVEAGGYESQNAFVVESLGDRLNTTRYDGSDPEIERWLRNEVGPTYDRWKREGTMGIPIEDVLDRLRARRLARKTSG